METLEYTFHDKTSLAKACLPFIKSGGIFLPTVMDYALGTEVMVHLKLPDQATALTFQGKVILVTPAHEQHQLPAGVGIQFAEADHEQVRKAIESIVPQAFSNEMKESVLIPKS